MRAGVEEGLEEGVEEEVEAGVEEEVVTGDTEVVGTAVVSFKVDNFVDDGLDRMVGVDVDRETEDIEDWAIRDDESEEDDIIECVSGTFLGRVMGDEVDSVADDGKEDVGGEGVIKVGEGVRETNRFTGMDDEICADRIEVVLGVERVVGLEIERGVKLHVERWLELETG